MLRSLSVSNYILIDSLDTTFPEGLNILSGETGAGKSILLGALSLVLGAKADASMVGPRGENCIVEAEFSATPEVNAILEKTDLPSDGEVLILRRSVGRSGRSRSFANDEPVTLAVLQELSARLVDIHSQNANLELREERFRMDALDLWAGTISLRQQCSVLWADILEKARILHELEERRDRAVRDEEFNSSRWERLRDAALRSGELEELEAEENRLAHASEIKDTLCAAENLLSPDDDSPSPSMILKETARSLEKVVAFVPAMKEVAARLESARLEVEDISAEVASANGRMEASPERLEEVQDRLSLLYSLMQKHGVKTVEELISERDRLGELVSDASALDDECRAASAELEALRAKHADICTQLHAKRLSASVPFAQEITKVFRSLELDHAIFEVALQEADGGANGSDYVHFLFSSTGRTPSDLFKAASGGELSRVMLSLKAVMARFTNMPTLIFDEIDSGVSGSAADKMGSLVCQMGRHMQVFAITHLPQVAAKGNAHYLVSKENDVTSIRLLDGEGRVQEIARMLSGSAITPEAIANARALLKA